MASAEPEKGDKVSWNWGGGAPGGTVAETKQEGQIAIESKRGNIIKKNASPDNPAVRVERSGNDVVKRASELTVESKAPENKKGGDKRKAESSDGPDDEEEEEEDEDAPGEDENPHVINKAGKEVKKGGKDANKQQKKHQNEDVKGKADESEPTATEVDHKEETKHSGSKKSGGSAKGKTTKNTSSQGDEDVVSSRTRSHEKAT